MTDLARKRFAQLGQQLQYDQLGTVRRQAEGWRNGLTGLTGLVGAVFVLKGRESVAGMPDIWRWTTAALLVLAFLLLLSGALRAVRAAHGQLGERTWLSGDLLFAAVLDEVERTQDALTSARRRSVTGLCLIVAAVAVSWVVPAEESATPKPARAYVLVATGKEVRCGELVISDREAVTIKAGKKGKPHRVPAEQVRSVTPVDRC
ncbi:hypothetical protein JIX56_36405 [Streptomyces sp. CA-210063]|uniref:hypothetical protein n=1 Tax=Streptomyces sp. CA-210063 TaxID=2801029 RepID=UPI00214B6CF4|nr:hypothetical protein [Streptomyces sp. CA-210063]UUU34903.1 hypothetical protein JIX56_36405 [Streptomyces sp. CA-210063]